MTGKSFSGSKPPYFKKRDNQRNSKHRRNERIRVPQVRLIGSDGKQIGVVPTEDALALAKKEELDLVEISPDARPPVCKILDYGKFLYEEGKKTKGAKKSNITKLKEIKLRLGIDQHDYLTKMRHAERFLHDGNKVKVTLAFRGREMDNKQMGFEIVNRTVSDLEQMGVPDAPPRFAGRNLSVTLSPLPEKKRKMKFNAQEDEE